jgi:hypothetical protein
MGRKEETMSKSFSRPSEGSAKGSNETPSLVLPDGLNECVYQVEFREIEWKEGVSKKSAKPYAFYVLRFVVDATDTNIKAGSKIEKTLNPTQAFADTYFYREMFDLIAALRGVNPTDETRAKLRNKINKLADANKDKLVSVDNVITMFAKLEGRSAVCRFVRKPAAKGDGYYTSWEAVGGDDE